MQRVERGIMRGVQYRELFLSIETKGDGRSWCISSVYPYQS